MKPETAQWVKRAQEDLHVAEVALQESLSHPCIFHCQQALEKLLKAIWVEQSPQGYPPREHNLKSLAQKAGLALSREQRRFFDDLSKQYKPTRYADVVIDYSREQAERYYERTCEEFERLRQLLS